MSYGKSGLGWSGFFAGFGSGVADLGLEVVVEVFEGGVEAVVVALDAADEHSAFEAGDEDVGDFFDIDGGLDCSGRDAFGKDGAEIRFPAGDGLADAIAEDGIAVVGVDGGVEDGAAAGQAGAGDEVGDVLFEAVDVVGDGVEVAAAAGAGEVPGIVEGFSGELFLVLKVPVDAAFFEVGGGHDVGEGTALVAALIEERRGLLDDALPGCFAFSHGCRPTGLDAE